MDKKRTQEHALQYLESLVGQTLRYGLKSYDMNLYDFGFGDNIQFTDSLGRTRSANRHNLHVQCSFKVIHRVGSKGSKIYYGDTEKEEFESDIKNLIDLSVKRVALSDKNDLWLDFEEYWVVIVTNEDTEESWRYFIMGKENPHLVAADSWLEFVW